MAPTPTILQWRNVTVAGDNSSLYHLDSLSGWQGDTPPSRNDSEGRPNAHGEFDTPVYAGARTVSLVGSCRTNTQRDALIAGVAAAFVFTGSGPTETLTCQMQGLTLTAQARVIRSAASRAAGEWGLGRFGFQVDFRCPDPLLYAAAQTKTVNMPAQTGGAIFPAFVSGVFSFGTLAAPASAVLTNAGSADSPVTLTVAAGGTALLGGFQIVEQVTGRILRYADNLLAGTTVVFSSRDSTVLLNGTDRRGSVTVAQWTNVPAAVLGVPTTRSFQLVGLSGTSATTTLTASMAPAYW